MLLARHAERGIQRDPPSPMATEDRERRLAKKAKKTKTRTAKLTQAKSSKRKTVARKPARRAAKKATQSKPARRKFAARAAATRKRKPEQQRTRLQKATSIARGAALTAVSAITRRLSWSTNENDPIELLMTDHRRFEELLKQGEDT